MSEVMAVHDDEKPVLDRHQVTSTHRTPHESRPNTQFEVHVLFSIMFGEHICYNGTMYRNPNTRCFLFAKLVKLVRFAENPILSSNVFGQSEEVITKTPEPATHFLDDPASNDRPRRCWREWLIQHSEPTIPKFESSRSKCLRWVPGWRQGSP